MNHSGIFPSITISFNLAPGVSLGDAVDDIEDVERKAGMPATISTSFSGTAQAFQSSLANEPLLIAAASLPFTSCSGILYESLIHPITILSTLPSAGVGAILALLMTHTDLSVIALIGIILLIGIVKKNAIMMIDFALEVERRDNKTPKEAVFQACLLRFRPIMMTTMAALLGGLPLALGRHRVGVAATAGHHHCRRFDLQPGADALHNAGDLSLHGSLEYISDQAIRTAVSPRRQRKRWDRRTKAGQGHNGAIHNHSRAQPSRASSHAAAERQIQRGIACRSWRTVLNRCAASLQPRIYIDLSEVTLVDRKAAEYLVADELKTCSYQLPGLSCGNGF